MATRKTRDVVLGGGKFSVRVVPVLRDNFSYVVICHATQQIAIVDVPEHEKVLREVRTMLPAGRSLDANSVMCLCTHKHHDHAPAAQLLKDVPNIRIFAGKNEPVALTKATKLLDDNDTFSLGELTVRTLFVPGHTQGHVAFHVTHPSSKEGDDGAVFTGDLIVTVGAIGAVNDNAPMEQMIGSLRRVMALPDATSIFPGHDYTGTYLPYAHKVEPNNEAVQRIMARSRELQGAGIPVVPATIGEEKAINPFLRAAMGVKELLERLPESARNPLAAFKYIYNNSP